MSSDVNLLKGGGLKRWKWTVKAPAKNGALIWKNQVQPQDQVFIAEYDSYHKEVAANSRLKLFQSYVLKEAGKHGFDPYTLIEQSIEDIKNKFAALASSPASCSLRKKIPSMITELFSFVHFAQSNQGGNETEKMLNTSNRILALDDIWGVLSELFPFPAKGYHSSPLCGWNSSDFATFAQILRTNELFIKQELESTASMLSLEDFLSTIGITQKYLQFKKIHPAKLDISTAPSKKVVNSVSSETDKTTPLTVVPFTGDNICFYTLFPHSQSAKWQADEAWLRQKPSLWPKCL